MPPAEHKVREAAATLRLAVAADWPEVMALRLSVAENRLSDPSRVTRDMYETYINRIGRGWVAERAGRIEGFCVARREGEVWALFVRPGCEGRGLGQALMGACVDWLVALGVAEAELETGAGTRAERFYRRFGWREVGRRGDDVILRLPLLPI
jgi:GNAT superfamily N-acetyltransferase